MAVVERQREYETVYILRPTASEDEREKARERVQTIVEKAGGHTLKFDDWGTRKLAYEIRDRANAEFFDRGRYQYYRFLAPSDTVAEVERNLRIVDTVLKYLTVKLADNLIADERVKEGVEMADLDVYATEEEE